MADPARLIISGRSSVDAGQSASPPAHTPCEAEDRAGAVRAAIAEGRDPWPSIRAYGRHQRDALLENASERHNDRPCTGFCDGAEDGVSKCPRHELTEHVAELEVDVRALIEDRLERLGIDGETAQLFVADVLDGLVTQARRGWF